MEKYKARENNSEKMPEVPEKTEKEKRRESSNKVAKTGLKAAAEYFAPGVGGAVVDLAANTKQGQKIINTAGKTISKNPILSRTAKKLDDQGMVDVADQAVDMVGGNPTSATGGAANMTSNLDSPLSSNSMNNSKSLNPLSKLNSEINDLEQKANEKDLSLASNVAGNLSTKFKDNKFLNDLSAGLSQHEKERQDAKKKLKELKAKRRLIYLKIGCPVFFFIIIFTVIVSAKDFGNLDLTNNTTSITGTGGTRTCSEEEIEDKLIYLGDSRMVGMEYHVTNDSIHFIAKSSMGYDWLTDTAIYELDSLLQEDNANYIVVLALGINDMTNIDKYVTYYKELMNKYSNTTFYVLSVNPVDEAIESQNGYYVKNSTIEDFNATLKENFSDNYIDTYSSLDTLDTDDGVHYNSSTNLEVHNLVLSAISSSGKVRCGASGDLAGMLEEVANWYIQDVAVYDQTLYLQSPFTTSPVRADCTGFAVAYMSYVAGVDIPISYSGEMVYPDGGWANTVSQYGWNAYSSDEIGSLQTGDILVAHSGALYSLFGQHAEIYVSETETFGWGSVKTVYPTQKTITTTTSGGHIHFQDSSHDYITIYRYEGALTSTESNTSSNSSSSTSSTSSTLDITKMYDSSFNHGTKSKSNQKYIMLHDTEMSQGATTVVQSWKNSGSGVAAHFVIDRDGTIIQAVDLDTITHHAGWGGPGNYDSKFEVGNNDGKGNGDDLVGTVPLNGYTSYGMNSYSIGIEMCHVNGEDYPEAQLDAVDKVIAYIDSYYGFKSTIIDHKEWRPSNSDTDAKFSSYLSNYKTLRHH